MDIVKTFEKAYSWYEQNPRRRSLKVEIDAGDIIWIWLYDYDRAGGVTITCPEDVDRFEELLIERKKSRAERLLKELKEMGVTV